MVAVNRRRFLNENSFAAFIVYVDSSLRRRGNTMRDAKGRWLKGVESPNPGGRPAVIVEVKRLAQNFTDKAVFTLVEIMEDKSAPTASRLAAANSILDRAVGRPMQALESKVEVYDAGKAHAAALIALTQRTRLIKET